MTFSEALNHIQHGIYMTRWGWHCEGMYVAFLSGKQLADALKYVDYILPNVKEFKDLLVKCTDEGEAIVGWIPSSLDMLSDDWYEYENLENHINK